MFETGPLFCRPRVVAAVVTLLTMSVIPNSVWCNDHYCGVYSAYTVLDHYGKKIDFESLLEPEYVAGFQGSTAEGVVAALADHGIAARSYSGLGVFDLRAASGPLILHVRGSQGTRRYDHWVVYLGEKEGEAVILDPSRGRSTLSYSRLLAMWDSVGIATAQSSLDLSAWRALGTGKRWGMLVLLGCLCVPLVRRIDRWISRPDARWVWLRPVAGAGALLAVFAVTALALDLLTPEGVLRNGEARGSIASVHAPVEARVIGLDEALQLHRGSQVNGSTTPVVWIDARFQRDYDYGHIPGSLSLPVDATFAQEDALVATLPSQAAVVVYCQSAGCGFASAVSERLRGHGFTNISIFGPGYRDWQSSGAAVESSRTNGNKVVEAESIRGASSEEGGG